MPDNFNGEMLHLMTMRWVKWLIGCCVLVGLGCGSPDAMGSGRESVAAEFVGSTPCDAGTREFFLGLGTNVPCHYVGWQVILLTNQNKDLPATYNLTAQYRIPAHSNTNQSEDGPKVISRGTWEILKGAKSRPDAVIYRLKAQKSERLLAFVQVGENLLHLLNPDGTLAIGTGGWSYTLNRADHAETTVEPVLANTAPEMSYTISPLATGPGVFAVFEGRSPCHGIARELNLPQHAGCMKAKWRVTLYQDPQTSAPATYKLEGTLFRRHPREGSWSITQGAKTDPNANVYEMNAEGQLALFLLKGDENVLFFLNQNREPLVGNADFSYTLNRRMEK